MSLVGEARPEIARAGTHFVVRFVGPSVARGPIDDGFRVCKVTKHCEWLQARNCWFVPVVAVTSGALHPETLRLLYDSARLKTDAAERHAVANSLRSRLTPEQLCQRLGATFARLRLEAQLYSLRASATRLTRKHRAAPYASSLLPRSRARARCGVGAFAPAPTAHVLASR